MDQDKALDKIKKCLRLVASGEPHEAAAAMRQAKALMAKHRLDESDVWASEVAEANTRSGAKNRPVDWETDLAAIVGRAYACRFLFISGAGQYRFIGEMAEIAAYTLSLLLRQVRQSRRDYISNHLTRCKAATKTKRADIFCSSWVWKVQASVMAFAGQEEPSTAVEAFMTKNYPELTTFKPVDRNAGKKRYSERDYKDAAHGSRAAAGVRLNHGVKGDDTLALN